MKKMGAVTPIFISLVEYIFVYAKKSGYRTSNCDVEKIVGKNRC